MKDVLCVILGGGRGTRLFPLTKERCKPAVPLLGKYRLIDIPVSNCLNSEFNHIYILTQFLSESLNKHINRTYKMDPMTKGFIDIMAAEQSTEEVDWFQGTADAVRRCMKHFNDPAIKYILILSGDQLYKMNLREMFRFHMEKKAELTIACNYVNPEDAADLGIIGIDGENRINKFVEKPADSGEIKEMQVKFNGEKRFLGSMGIYLFNKDTLIDLLAKDRKIDFGREIIPESIHQKSAYAYLFEGYWRDIGSIRTFYEENLAMTDPLPPLDMFDEAWQIFTRTRYLAPSKILESHIETSIVSEGTIILTSKIIHSIIGLRLRVGENTFIEDTIAMGCDYYETVEEMNKKKAQGIPALGIGANCEIKKAVLDKNVRVGDSVKILNKKGIDNFDGPNYYIRDGIVIITKGTVIPAGTII